jgi:hypothetical protein
MATVSLVIHSLIAPRTAAEIPFPLAPAIVDTPFSNNGDVLAQKSGVFNRSAQESKFFLLIVGGECMLM